MKTILKLILVTGVFALVSSLAYGQQVNPNRLPACPLPDRSKNTDQKRHAHWTNCWGRYRIELDKADKGVVVEGEWKNGILHGQGTFTLTDGSRFQGEFRGGRRNGQGTMIFNDGTQYQGEYRDDKAHGKGTYIYGNGDRFQGEFRGGKRNGQGTWFYADGDRIQGIWENDNLIRQTFYSPNSNSNAASNADRIDTDQERQQLGEERSQQTNPDKLPPCPKDESIKFHNCFATLKTITGDVYAGEFKDDNFHGQGTYTFKYSTEKLVGEFKNGEFLGNRTHTAINGEKYVGEQKSLYPSLGKSFGIPQRFWKHGWGTFTHPDYTYAGEFKYDKYDGQGIYTDKGGVRYEGIWENGKFIREAKVSLPDLVINIATNTNQIDISQEHQQLAEERLSVEEDKRQREQQRRSKRLNVTVSNTQPASDGSFTINIQTNADTASLKINGEEQGGRANGDYLIRKFARAGQETKFTIVAIDINGNTDTKTIAVSRAVVESKAVFAALNPANIKKQAERDAVAVIIGIANYKN